MIENRKIQLGEPYGRLYGSAGGSSNISRRYGGRLRRQFVSENSHHPRLLFDGGSIAVGYRDRGAFGASPQHRAPAGAVAAPDRAAGSGWQPARIPAGTEAVRTRQYRAHQYGSAERVAPVRRIAGAGGR